MALSCYCDDDYGWYYDLSEPFYTANSTGTCYGCGNPIAIGQPVGRVFEFTINEYYEESETKIVGRMCEQCLDMHENLHELGFCLVAEPGFIKEAHREYVARLPSHHIITRG